MVGPWKAEVDFCCPTRLDSEFLAFDIPNRSNHAVLQRDHLLAQSGIAFFTLQS